jgi:predicted nuclease with TOPRIM domain
MPQLLAFFASRAAVVVSGFLAGALLAWNAQDLRLDAVRAAHERYVVQAERVVAQQEAKWRKEKEDALQEAQKRLEKTEAERAALAAATFQLRRDVSALRKRLANAPPAACVDAAAATGELLAECVEEYRDLAGKAQRHVNDLDTFGAAWPR